MAKFEELYLKWVRRLHMVIPCAALLPAFYIMISFGDSDGSPRILELLYVTCLLQLFLLIPVWLIYLAQDRVKSLAMYIACAAVICAAAAGLSYLTGRYLLKMPQSITWPVIDTVIMLIFTADAMQVRYSENDRIRSKKEADLNWNRDVNMLPEPSVYVVIVFAVIYVLSLFLHSTQLGDIALVLCIVYVPVMFCWIYLSRRKTHLDSMLQLQKIPAGRIRRQSLLLTAAVIAIVLLAGILAFLMRGSRSFVDAGGLNLNLKVPSISDFFMPGMTPDGMREAVLETGGASAEPPAWLTAVLTVIDRGSILLILAAVMTGIVMALRRAARAFLKVQEDETEGRSMADEDEHTDLSLKSSRRSSKVSRIRRKYKRTILKYRKKAPDISETPCEMEQIAGIADTEDMKELHALYENARYH